MQNIKLLTKNETLLILMNFMIYKEDKCLTTQINL